MYEVNFKEEQTFHVIYGDKACGRTFWIKPGRYIEECSGFVFSLIDYTTEEAPDFVPIEKVVGFHKDMIRILDADYNDYAEICADEDDILYVCEMKDGHGMYLDVEPKDFKPKDYDAYKTIDLDKPMEER